MLNFKVISSIIGILLMVIGGLMLTPIPFSLYYGSEDIISLLICAAFTIIFGAVLWYTQIGSSKRIGKREGYLIVSIGWISMSVFCTLPYLVSGVIPGITDAFFESVSGLTTTGATVLTDIESVPKGILFWRSLTQWIGGMGIIVLTVAIFPLLGIGGVELFVAEAPGPTSDKLHPRIADTAKILWSIYVGLTVILIFLLWLVGMNVYDAFNHGLTTMATGGFSTKNASIAHFQNPSIHYVITLFMFMAGINYTVIYYGIKGKLKRVWRSDEFKTYLFLVLILIAVVTYSLQQLFDQPIEVSFREAAFQVISIITTTGFVSADYTSWSPALSLLFFIMLFLGACAGSTSGGVKLIRHLVFFKNSTLEFKRLLHPKALIRIKIDNQLVAARVLTHILVFLLVYLIFFVFGSLMMAAILADFSDPILTAIGSVATSLGNVGPAIGSVGPEDNFSAIPALGKWILVFLMLLGRLELFTILVLFMPYFWRMN